VSGDREHMSEIGRKGGLARQRRRLMNQVNATAPEPEARVLVAAGQGG
jgi:general stress protein YciG